MIDRLLGWGMWLMFAIGLSQLPFVVLGDKLGLGASLVHLALLGVLPPLLALRDSRDITRALRADYERSLRALPGEAPADEVARWEREREQLEEAAHGLRSSQGKREERPHHQLLAAHDSSLLAFKALFWMLSGSALLSAYQSGLSHLCLGLMFSGSCGFFGAMLQFGAYEGTRDALLAREARRITRRLAQLKQELQRAALAAPPAVEPAPFVRRATSGPAPETPPEQS